MLLKGLYTLARHHGSNKQLANYLDLHESAISQLMSGYDISFLSAIKVEIASKGKIPAECLLAHCGKNKWGKLVKQFRAISQQQVMTAHNKLAYQVKKPLLAIHPSLSTHSPLMERLQELAVVHCPIVDENDGLILGRNRLHQLKARHLEMANVLVINMADLLATETSMIAPYPLNQLERLAIALTLEANIKTLKKATQAKSGEKSAYSCPNLDKIYPSKDAYVAERCHIGGRSHYHKLKSLAKKGIPALLTALCHKQLSLHKAYTFACLPQDKQKDVLTDFLKQTNRERQP